MNNQNYATWLPEAGGYVHDGKVVSTNPIFDANGMQEVDVDLSRLTPQTGQATLQTASQTTGNVDTYDYTKGVGGAFGWKANKEGSGEDANADVTNVGSMASLTENTENTDYGPLNSPATESRIADVPAVSPLEQAQKDYQYMVATNNLKGQIDALTRMSQINGEDYTPLINSLTEQRNQKIKTQDDAYSRQISDAYASGDYETAAKLQQEQDAYRNKVGYQDMAQQEYQTKQQEIQVNYQMSYMQGINDITNALIQQVGNFLNFQYDPTQDRALQVAQGYAVGAVKEQMNHTGMYFSSMTQGAITRAVAELVPVYEKMAREELKENISMLQSTANYLMNLEQTQFNLWKGQLEVKWEANNERRKEYQAALDRTNAWGYVSNEDAAILCVAPGTLSPNAMAEARKLQQEIEKENRSLKNQMTLADYNNTLAIQKMYADAELDDWLDQQKQARSYSYSSALKNQQYQQDYNLQLLKNSASKSSSSSSSKKGSGSQVLTDTGAGDEVVEKYQSILSGDATKAETVKWFANNLLKEEETKNDTITNARGEKHNNANHNNALTRQYNKFTTQYNDAIVGDYLENQAYSQIDEIVQDKFTSDYGTTKAAYDEALAKAKNIASVFAQSKVQGWEEYAAQPYEYLIDKIEEAAEFDYSWQNIYDDYTKSKYDAMNDIKKMVAKDKNLGSDVAKIIEEHINEIHDASKVNVRDDLINNNVRAVLGAGDQIIKTGTGIADSLIGAAEPYIEKGKETINKINNVKNGLTAKAVLSAANAGSKLLSQTGK